MPNESQDHRKLVELLEKSVALQMHALGAPQSSIAKSLGKSKTWVNDLLRGVPKEGAKNDGKKKRR